MAWVTYKLLRERDLLELHLVDSCGCAAQHRSECQDKITLHDGNGSNGNTIERWEPDEFLENGMFVDGWKGSHVPTSLTNAGNNRCIALEKRIELSVPATSCTITARASFHVTGAHDDYFVGRDGGYGRFLSGEPEHGPPSLKVSR